MKLLKRNLRTFYYRLYQGLTADRDENGNRTGEVTMHYGEPIEMKGNISPSTGEMVAQTFGKYVDYDKSVIVEGTNLPIDENTVFCIDVSPFDEDGSINENYDYIVTRVAESLTSTNHTVYAVKKVKS